MQFFTLASLLCAAAAATFAAPAQTTATVSYDPIYDNAAGSLDAVACSDGRNGLETLGYTTFGSLPDFPYIGGAFAVAGWDSASCGTCWQLSYDGPGESINILAVDYAAPGTFNIALEAMNVLTKNQAVSLGRVPVIYLQLPASACQNQTF